MSRAYRITVKESTTRDLKGSDEIATQLEVLEILPPERMGELLKKELKDRGFKEEEDGTLTRREGNVTVKVDPKSCEVSVKAHNSIGWSAWAIVYSHLSFGSCPTKTNFW